MARSFEIEGFPRRQVESCGDKNMNPQVLKNTVTPDELLENIEQRREGLCEILITAIIFGLTMNLISDVITITLYEHVAIVTVVSVLITIGLLWFMIRRQIGGYAEYRRSLKLVLMWDSQKGEILARDTGYLPQLITRTLFSKLPQERIEKIKHALMLKPETHSDGAVVCHLVEGVLFTLFERMTAVRDDMESIRVNGSIPTDSLLLAKDEPFRMPQFDKESVKYKRRKGGEGVFTIRWNGGFLASIEIKYKPSKIAYFDDRPDMELAGVDSFDLDEFADLVVKIAKSLPKTAPEIFPERNVDFEKPKRTGPVIRADVEIKVKLGFSSVWYQLRPARINKIWKWGMSFIGALDSSLNWESYKARVLGVKMAKDILKQTRFGEF